MQSEEAGLGDLTLRGRDDGKGQGVVSSKLVGLSWNISTMIYQCSTIRLTADK